VQKTIKSQRHAKSPWKVCAILERCGHETPMTPYDCHTRPTVSRDNHYNGRAFTSILGYLERIERNKINNKILCYPERIEK
jgi:hypothetical protein